MTRLRNNYTHQFIQCKLHKQVREETIYETKSRSLQYPKTSRRDTKTEAIETRA